MSGKSRPPQALSMRPPGPTLFDSPFGSIDHLDEGVVGVVGMPTDWTHSSRIGAREGPAALRQATTELCRTVHGALGETVVDPKDRRLWRRADRGNIVDCGDAPIDPASVERTTESIAAMTEAVRAQGAIPLALGGDHYNSYPACLGYARGLAKRYPDRRFGYIQIDGHLDFADRLGAWGSHNHATNGRRNSELPNIERSNMVWIGITGWVDGDELALIEKMGGKIFSSGDVHEVGAEEVARRAVAHATRGCESLYLSIDIDAMDAGFLPGTGSIVPSGITPRQYCQILDVIAQENVDGIDIAEVAPSLDPSGRTERIAAHLLYHVVRNRFLAPATENSR
jgi:arginase family enzyme